MKTIFLGFIKLYMIMAYMQAEFYLLKSVSDDKEFSFRPGGNGSLCGFGRSPDSGAQLDAGKAMMSEDQIAQAQGQIDAAYAALDEAKYITTLKVVTDHKMKDADLEPDVDRLRENERFKKELIKMLGKLDNSRPNSAKNQKIMRILERAGKEVYNELK